MGGPKFKIGHVT